MARIFVAIILVLLQFTASHENEVRLECLLDGSTCTFRDVVIDFEGAAVNLIVETHKYKINKVIFQNSDLYEIPQVIFNEFPNLQVLENCNSLTNFTTQVVIAYKVLKSAFQKCVNLHYIDMQSQVVTTLEAGSFDGLENLLSLKISNIAKLPENLFDSLVFLKFLKMGSGLNEIPEFLLKNLKNLENIDLSRNKIKKIGGNLFHNLFNLQTVNFESNQIEEIADDAFSSPKKLVKVNFYINRITKVSRNFFDNLKDVGELNFMNNQIESIESLGNCKVQTLDFRINRIASVNPTAFQNCSTTKSLWMYGNKIEQLDENIFSKMTNLGSLGFAQNPITSLPKRLFANLKELSHLQIYFFKKMTELPDGIFDNNLKLSTVVLAGSSLKEISDNLFRNNFQISYLDLRTNRLSKITPNLLGYMPKLTTLLLSENICINEDFKNVQKELQHVQNQIEQCHTLLVEGDCSFEQTNFGYGCAVRNFNLDLKQLEPTGVHLPGKSDSDVESVVFENSTLHSMPGEIFEKFTNLYYLDMRATNVQNFEALEKCGNILQVLFLSSNNLKNLSAIPFHNCTRLRYLELTSNKLERIELKTFNKNSNLDTIHLDSNKISAIEPCKFMENFNNLKEINLRNNLCASNYFKIQNETDILQMRSELKNCFGNWYYQS